MSFIIAKFSELITTSVNSSARCEASSPLASKPRATALPVQLEGKKLGLDFSTIRDFSTPEAVEVLNGEDHTTVVNSILSWLIEAASTIIKKVVIQADFLKFQQKVVDSKADAEEVKRLQERLLKVELECDETRQRGMKGNLVLHSPATTASESILLPRQKTREGGIVDKESMAEACVRAIETKTGIRVPLEDVSACHPLGRKGAVANTTFIIRIWNRKQHSAWEQLTAGLMTGRNPKTGADFTNAPLYINYQLTPARGEVVKVVREAKRGKRLHKYNVDANGRCFVQLVDRYSQWKEVKAEEDLKRLVASRHQQQPSSQHRWGSQRQ